MLFGGCGCLPGSGFFADAAGLCAGGAGYITAMVAAMGFVVGEPQGRCGENGDGDRRSGDGGGRRQPWRARVTVSPRSR